MTNFAFPNAAQWPELRFRYFEGEADYALIAELFNASQQYNAEAVDTTAERVKLTMMPLPNFDPYKDMILVLHEGEPVAAVGWFSMPQNDGSQILNTLLRVVHRWEGHGLGEALLSYAENQLRTRVSAETAANTQFMFAETIVREQPQIETVLQGAGYAPIRYSCVMVRPNLDDIPDIPLPDGLEMRPARPEDYRTIYYANREAFSDHFGSMPGSDEDFERTMQHRFNQPHLWVVIWDGHKVAGSIWNFINQEENAQYQRKRGYTESISTNPPYRGKGLAKAMLTRSFEILKREGMTEAALGVDTQNVHNALKLYESMGFEVVVKETIYGKPYKSE